MLKTLICTTLSFITLLGNHFSFHCIAALCSCLLYQEKCYFSADLVTKNKVVCSHHSPPRQYMVCWTQSHHKVLCVSCYLPHYLCLVICLITCVLLSASLPVCLVICLITCVCLVICLITLLSVSLPVCVLLSASLPVCLVICLITCVCLVICLVTCVCLVIYLFTCMCLIILFSHDCHIVHAGVLFFTAGHLLVAAVAILREYQHFNCGTLTGINLLCSFGLSTFSIYPVIKTFMLSFGCGRS